jgi:hypothetical protein
MGEAGAACHFRLDLHLPQGPTSQYGILYFNNENQCVSLVPCNAPVHDMILMGSHAPLR